MYLQIVYVAIGILQIVPKTALNSSFSVLAWIPFVVLFRNCFASKIALEFGSPQGVEVKSYLKIEEQF